MLRHMLHETVIQQFAKLIPDEFIRDSFRQGALGTYWLCLDIRIDSTVPLTLNVQHVIPQ